ncbi:tetratricopeptide repeat protein [Pseudoflavitalea sp. G-6-1-2]|uniref:tetratricopeptide repeat protein n=1 Tax=Pseudoflavitalea sp. G-6-1-2 TaxID=2728841 RepID=UPI00146EEE72|nr:tetratricopeptide repeat protein [Pseudoflavitalea sp. G-6-1-2]NML21600.1 tetratricopeptide repeat protein [Pseudoflavitalea sp. G-6-1-2]
MKYTATALALICSTAAFAQQSDAASLIYHQRYASARTIIESALKTDASNAGNWYLLTQTFPGTDSTAALRAALSAAPDAVKAMPLFEVGYGHLLLKENKKDSAAWYFNRAIEATKEKDAAVLTGVAKAHIEVKTGDVNYALSMLDKAMKREKKDPELSALQGDAWRRSGDGTQAYKAYSQALDKDKNYSAALYQLGKIFVAQKNDQLYVDYFEKAINADSTYAPAYYELYYHYYYKDIPRAMEYFLKYRHHSDPSADNEYQLADLLYLSKNYQPAIDKAKTLLSADPANARLYKLLAYSYLEFKDTATAMQTMTQYFAKGHDSTYLPKDFETMAGLYSKQSGKEDSAIAYYEKAAAHQSDTLACYAYYKKLKDLCKQMKQYSNEAKWSGKYFAGNDQASNLDLFNWGLAHFKAEEFVQADTVFGTYIAKYPDQAFGYYWRARSNSMLDTAMTEGTAIPHYHNLIAVLEKDTANATNRKWLVEAYGYVAAYETNKEKDYPEAIAYLQKILAIDPANKDAQRYISVLEKNVGSKQPAPGGKQ